MIKKKINFNDIVKQICKVHKINNKELSNILECNISFIYRIFNNERNVPYEKAILLMKELINRGIDIYSFVFNENNKYLYHGSKRGLNPPIKYDYSLKKHSDFGQGFYIGESFMQSSTFISSYNINESRIYSLSINNKDSEILDITPINNKDYRWIMFIAYNRGYIDVNNSKELFQELNKLKVGYNIIKGPIADDRMTTIMDKFFNNTITDIEVKEALTRLKLGNQYCFINNIGCSKINIIEEISLDDTTNKLILDYERSHHEEAVNYANKLITNRYRSGKTYNQIIKEIKKRGWKLVAD